MSCLGSGVFFRASQLFPNAVERFHFRANAHSGNRIWRRLIEERKDLYRSLDKRSKAILVESVIVGKGEPVVVVALYDFLGRWVGD